MDAKPGRCSFVLPYLCLLEPLIEQMVATYTVIEYFLVRSVLQMLNLPRSAFIGSFRKNISPAIQHPLAQSSGHARVIRLYQTNICDEHLFLTSVQTFINFDFRFDLLEMSLPKLMSQGTFLMISSTGIIILFLTTDS